MYCNHLIQTPKTFPCMKRLNPFAITVPKTFEVLTLTNLALF